MVQPLPPAFRETASQTAGPYVHIGLIPHQAGFDIFDKTFSNVLVTPNTQGERIRVEGRVFDGAGEIVRDALIEIWQANAAGRYNHPADLQADKAVDRTFRGWGRTGSDFETGLYRFDTIKPGPVVGRKGHRPQAPHLNVWIAARGINIGLQTRMYFSDEAERNADDPVLGIIEQASRRETLIGHLQDMHGRSPGEISTYVFDIYLQGDRETVFFDL